MPVYEHHCSKHGLFEDIRPFSQSGSAAECPTCGALCNRVISLPQLRGMDPSHVKARDINERSKVEPHVCGSGCSHNHGRAKSQNTKGQDGKQTAMMYKGPRPWVIEHA